LPEKIEGDKKIKKTRCLYWPLCERDSCAFFHPQELCKHFPNCSYGEKCLYIHPQLPNPSTYPTTQPFPVFSRPCKRGFVCSRTINGQSCYFSHPEEACRYGKWCVNFSTNSCKYSHAQICKFGPICSNPSCTFAHVSNKGIKCKFDKTCNNESCPYLHEDETNRLSLTLPNTPPRSSAKEMDLVMKA